MSAAQGGSNTFGSQKYQACAFYGSLLTSPKEHPGNIFPIVAISLAGAINSSRPLTEKMESPQLFCCHQSWALPTLSVAWSSARWPGTKAGQVPFSIETAGFQPPLSSGRLLGGGESLRQPLDRRVPLGQPTQVTRANPLLPR